MKSVRLKNFRCFRDEQSIPLAPLTLLVGENSTGKTSFMALIHAMNGIMVGEHPSISWKDPYGFGNLNQTAYSVDGDHITSNIESGFSMELSDSGELVCDFTFEPTSEPPFSVAEKLTHNDVWVSAKRNPNKHESYMVEFGTLSNVWSVNLSGSSDNIWPLQLLQVLGSFMTRLSEDDSLPLFQAWSISQEDRNALIMFQKKCESHPFTRSFAGAPIRSKPHRTYDHIPSQPDSEGSHIPVYLAELFRKSTDAWNEMKNTLQGLGKAFGLFDEISIEGDKSDLNKPFQIHVKEHLASEEHEGSFRNLIDMGYGVSQILPVVTELLRRKRTSMFLLQQPEVHLHPSAQAALGSFFCDFASWNTQLVVETHSDYIINRVRMEVRDKTSNLSPSDVLVLYFERVGLDVKIHPITFDESGNVVGAPDTYNQFFLDETARSIGI